MTINLGNSESIVPGQFTSGNTPNQNKTNIFDTFKHSNLKGNQLVTIYLLIILAISLPLIGYRVTLNNKAAPLTPPITPPNSPSPIPSRIVPSPVPTNYTNSYISLVSPTNNSVFYSSNPITLIWKSTPNIRNVDVFYKKIGGNFIKLATVPNTGRYVFTLPSFDGKNIYTIQLSGQCAGAITTSVDITIINQPSPTPTRYIKQITPTIRIIRLPTKRIIGPPIREY